MNVIDIILIVVIFLCTLVGLQKGLVRSLLGFVGYLAATVAASSLGQTLSQLLYRNVLRGMLVKRITSILTESAEKTAAGRAGAVLKGLPVLVVDPLRYRGMTAESLSDVFSGTIQSAAPKMADLLSPAVIGFSRLVLTIVLFCVFMMLVRMVIRAVSAVFHLPILRQINTVLGGVFGLCTGGAVAVLLCLLLQLALPMTKDGLFGITRKQLDDSIVYQTIYRNSPVYSMLSEE